MSAVTMDIAGRKIDGIVRDVERFTEEGYDVILQLDENPSPQRILKILKATAGRYKIDLTIRHAELEEYVENTLAGALAGGFITGAAALIAAVATGNPIPLKVFFQKVGIGAAIGGVLGLCSTPIAGVKIYKYRGETRIKFLAES